ncbi:MAG TPA: hypothetical protein DCG12_01980 [Planctomycetaceae bacterium]|nr:hypothetical protein [Planctomycetaceae bacterium]
MDGPTFTESAAPSGTGGTGVSIGPPGHLKHRINGLHVTGPRIDTVCAMIAERLRWQELNRSRQVVGSEFVWGEHQ